MRLPVACFLLTVCPLAAQTFTGVISGRVTDPSGSAVPQTQVTVTEVSTNGVWKTATNEVGDYNVSYLKPGVYRVSFAAPGFKERVERDAQLQLNQQLRLDASLEVGSVSEVVEVSAAASQVNYVSPEIGHVVGEQQLLNVPLLASNSRGRSPLLLAKLLPGVSSTNYGNINNFSFGGGRPVTNEILVDGLPTTNPSDQTYTLTPSPDSVQEFKVLTTPFSAEYGHTGGGIMMLTTRSGSNQLHGSVYDFFRNRVFNARNFFSPNNLQKWVQNNPGATLGGPVRLPGYNGRDRTFFFTDFNVTLASTGNQQTLLVPTGLERAGDFSQTTAGGRQVAIYDPLVPNARTPFAGNRIPASRLDSVGREIVKFYPEPNGQFGTLNYSIRPPQGRQTWQAITRVDHHFSSNDKMFVRYGYYNPNAEAQPRIPTKANNDTAGGFRDTQIVLSETHVFGPTAVNDFRVGMAQEVNYTIASGGPAPELGLRGVSLTSFPIIQVQQMIQLGSSADFRDRNRTWAFSESLTLQRGRHTLKLGGDYRRQMWNTYSPGKLAGSYSFNPRFSSLPGAAQTGFALADLLLGLPDSTSISINDYTYRTNINSAGIHIQDDFKATSRLTLNLGVRWDYAGPSSEANGQFANFNPTLRNRTTGNLGEVEFAKRNGAPSHFTPNIYRNFQPRIGFAWNAGAGTVLRGGYGVYRLPSIGFGGFGLVSQYAVSAQFTSLDAGITPRYQLANGVPAYSFNVDDRGLPNVPASLTRPTSAVTALETRARTPYNQIWSLGVQRQLGRWFAEIDYVGNKGTKLPVFLPLNQLRPEQFGAPQAQRPFPQYVGAGMLAHDGNSIYHALQTKLEHRWHNGLLLSAAYTFSKLIDDVDAPARANGVPIQNVYDLKGERGIGGYDVPHRLVAHYVWSAPVGRGGRFLHDTPVVRDIIGGWQLAGITEFQVGLPMPIGQTNNTFGFTDTQRPNQVAKAALPRAERRLERWFNTEAFTAAPARALGGASRFPLYSPGINSWDLSLMRNFPFRERWTLQFRAEFYNAFNHPNFNRPNTTIGNSSYGRITGAQASRITEFALRIFF